MLHTFLIENHDEIVSRARKRVAGRTAPRATEVELTNGTEYARQVQRTTAAEETERLGAFSHELRNSLNVALLSIDTIKQGLVGPSGSTGEMHGRSPTKTSTGLGLGLFIARELVTAHGGKLDVTSSAGGGTTFTTRLPRQAVTQ